MELRSERKKIPSFPEKKKKHRRRRREEPRWKSKVKAIEAESNERKQQREAGAGRTAREAGSVCLPLICSFALVVTSSTV